MPGDERRRKRRRIVRSCTECYRRKKKCDQLKPCSQCTNVGSANLCVYSDDKNSINTHIQDSPLQQGNSCCVGEGNALPSPSTVASSERQQSSTSEPRGSFRGILDKTRIYGPGHWMAANVHVGCIPSFDAFCDHFASAFYRPHQRSAVARGQLAECKLLIQKIKEKAPNRRSLGEEIRLMLPQPERLLDLAKLFFKTFGVCFVILEQKEFITRLEKYAREPERASTVFLLQVALVVALTQPLHTEADGSCNVQISASNTVSIAQSWLMAPIEKKRHNIASLQVHCLLLLARQVHNIGADMIWISVGALIRTAIRMGLHLRHDDLNSEEIRQQSWIRHRLWRTILEIEAQSAMDAGVVPMTLSSSHSPDPQPATATADETHALDEHSTQRDYQSLLVDSLSLRCRVLATTCDLFVEPDYDTIVALDEELKIAARKLARALETDASSNSTDLDPPGTVGFARNLCTHLFHRFNFVLHHNYALQSPSKSLYRLSYQSCLNTTLDLISFLQPVAPVRAGSTTGPEPLYPRLLIIGGSLFRDITTYGILVLFMEIGTELDLSQTSLSASRHRTRAEELLQDARRAAHCVKQRFATGVDMNLKPIAGLAMLLAQADAILTGKDKEIAVQEALKEGLQEALERLRRLVGEETSQGEADADRTQEQQLLMRDWFDTPELSDLVDLDLFAGGFFGFGDTSLSIY